MTKVAPILTICFVLALFATAQNDSGPPDPATTGSPAAPPHQSISQNDNVIWSQVSNALYPFGRAGTAVLGNYLYCFGSEGSNVAQAFNITTEQWQASTPALVGYDNWPAVATTNAIYLIGRSAVGVVGDEVQRFIPNGGEPTGTWTLMSDYPIAAYGISAAWDGGNLIYASGGHTGFSDLNLVYRYDISGNTWQRLADLPAAMEFAGAAYIGGKYHVMGGTETGNAHYAYDPALNQWTAETAVPTAIYFATASVSCNESYIFSVGGGGGYASWPATDAVQIYDPANGTWQVETPLPVARGCNSACWIGSGEVISAGGFANGWSNITYRGVGFPGGLAHDVDITLDPVAPPIIIPAAGGSFNYNVTLHNNEISAVAFDAWIMVQLPVGSWYGPALGPVSLTLPGGGTLIRQRTQNVPASAPAGLYTYRGYVGDYATALWDSSSFTFTKLGSGAIGLGIGGWTNSGQSFADNGEAFLTQRSSPITSVSPNPFNPTTVASYELRVASHVSLRVYDTAGRLATTLVDGWREAGTHAVTLNGSGWAAGVYIYRLQAGDYSTQGKLVLLK